MSLLKQLPMLAPELAGLIRNIDAGTIVVVSGVEDEMLREALESFFEALALEQVRVTINSLSHTITPSM
jgi:hypothetical protein